MLRHILGYLLVCIGLLWTVYCRAAESSPELYLSYEQRVVLTYAMMAHGEPAEVQRAYLERAEMFLLSAAKKPVQTVHVKNFEEFIKHFRGEWPETQSVSLDLSLIEAKGARAWSEYKADSPRVQNKIDRYLKWQMEQLNEMSHSESLAEKALQSKETLAAALLVLQNPQSKELAKSWILEKNQEIFADKMKEFDRIGEKIASRLGSSQDVTMRIVLQTMFSEYFARLSLQSKKIIVSSYLGGNLYATDLEKFEIMVQNSGPQLQKLLQIVARQGDLGPDMVKVFKTLEDAVRPVPWVQVQEILQGEGKNYQFIYFERKPLGVGTMAQVHRAKIMVEGKRQDVVVRFIKPDIDKRVEEDSRILKEVARILDSNPEFAKTGAPKLSPIVADVTATVTAELSQQDTIARQKFAKGQYEQRVLMRTPGYKNYIDFHVPAIFDPAPSSQGQSKLMVQEMVIGKKLDKEAVAWADIVPDLKKGVVEALARLWGNEMLFGSGFYHSDLHQGNFMVRLTDEKIQVNILDFGMGGVISHGLQNSVMILGAGVELQSSDLIARAFWQISNREANQITERQLHSLVEARLKEPFADPEERSIDGWTKWAMNQGLRLPYDFVSLNRGMVIVSKLLKDSGSDLSIVGLIKSYGFKNPGEVYRRMVIEEKVSRTDLMKLGVTEILKKMKTDSPMLSSSTTDLSGSATLRCEAIFLSSAI